MSEQQFLWNSLDGGENVFIKERGSDKIIHIKIIEGKHEFVDFMKKVNGQQAEIERLKKALDKIEKLQRSKAYWKKQCKKWEKNWEDLAYEFARVNNMNKELLKDLED